MATYRELRRTRLAFERGHIEQRIYDTLAVDMLVHSLTRASVWALKVGRKPQLPRVGKKLHLPLTQRSLMGET